MPLDLDASKLLSLHGVTRDVAQICLKQLKAHVDTIAPLLRPRRFLGDHMEGVGKEAVPTADRNLAELQELYGKVAVKPFDLRPELKSPLASVSAQFQFHEWEYGHAAKTAKGWQQIRVTSPLTWVLTFASPYSVATLADAIAGSATKDTDAVREFVLHACLMSELFRKFPTLTDLFAGLRYKVEVRRSPLLGDLPLVTVSAPYQTARPSDDLVVMASGLAGGAAFYEVLDLDSIRKLSDPLREETLKILRQHKVDFDEATPPKK
jgi:hypothetical protein